MRPALIGPITIELDPSENTKLSAVWDGYEPPLGILTLASALRCSGAEPTVFDLDGFIRDFLDNGAHPKEGFEAAVSALTSLEADLFGFGTICGSYPLTIRLAEQVHRLRPEVRIVLGGPQASAVDVSTLEEFPFIDAVIRGEADRTIAHALEQIFAGGAVRLPSVTYRKDGRVVRNVDAPVVMDLDAVPAPAFDLSQYAGRCSRLPVEIGRGCPFACTFCSTNDFFKRRFRLRSPSCVLSEMQRLETLFGVTDFDLVHDMFTVDRKRVVEFCRFMQSSGTSYTWHCSARTDFVDRELLGIMHSAGCRSLFFGVETGSARLQKIIGKDLGIDEAEMAVRLTDEAGMRSTVSLIVGFPEEEAADLEATASFALNAARFDSTRVQVGILAALPGTPLYREFRERLVLDAVISEQSWQSWGQDQKDRALVARHPAIFSSFYGVPAGMGREYIGEFRWFFKYAVARTRWLAVALGRERDSILKMFNLWLSSKSDLARNPRYYSTSAFAVDLCRFVAERLTADDPATDSAELMASYYEAMYSILLQPVHLDSRSEHEEPVVPSSITILDFPFRPSRVIDRLRLKGPLDPDCLQPSAVAFRRDGDHIAEARELPPLAAAILRLCDGRTTIAGMTRDLCDSCPEVPGVSAQDFLKAGLECLAGEGLVAMPALQELACPPFKTAGNLRG
jgi:radical SAM superfamily enzyme YgiQ (UPF0313 family)